MSGHCVSLVCNYISLSICEKCDGGNLGLRWNFKSLGYTMHAYFNKPLQWRHNGCDNVSNHQHHDSLLNRLFRRRSKRTSKLRVTALWAGNSPGTGEFPAQMTSYAENASIWWRHHGCDHVTSSAKKCRPIRKTCFRYCPALPEHSCFSTIHVN